MKATALIEQQHREVEGLFESIEASKANARLLDQLAATLTGHALIEEELFYPVALKIKRELVLESYEDHELMAYALKRLVACDPRDESFEAKVKALKELVLEHVQDEEQELLPAVTEAFPEEEDGTLGLQMEARFNDVVQGGYEGALAARKAKRSADGHRVRTGTAGAKKKSAHAHRKAA